MNSLTREVKDKPFRIVQCQHPGCTEQFLTNGPAKKYCKEHAKSKYRNKEKIVSEDNQIINHSYKIATKINCKCDLCKNEFEILILPRTYIYPKFCPEHRTVHKRKMYLKLKLS